MKLNDSLFEDVSRLASGAASALSGIRDQFDARRPGCGTDAPSITRQEFDVLAAMLEKARDVQEELLRRVAALEGHCGIGTDGPATEPGGEDI